MYYYSTMMTKYSKKTWKATAMLSVNNQSSMKIPYSFQLSQQDYSWTKQSARVILNLIQTFAPPPPPPQQQQTNMHTHKQQQTTTNQPNNLPPYHLHFPPQKTPATALYFM